MEGGAFLQRLKHDSVLFHRKNVSGKLICFRHAV